VAHNARRREIAAEASAARRATAAAAAQGGDASPPSHAPAFPPAFPPSSLSADTPPQQYDYPAAAEVQPYDSSDASCDALDALDVNAFLRDAFGVDLPPPPPPPPPLPPLTLAPPLAAYEPYALTLPVARAPDAAAWLTTSVYHVKLPSHDAADALPSPPDALGAWLLAAMAPLALTACVRPGCTLLTFDVLHAARGDASAGEDASQPAAEAPMGAAGALARLLRDGGAAGAFFRAQGAVCVRVGDEEVTAAPSGSSGAAAAPAMAPPAGPRPPRLSPLALLSTSPEHLMALSCAAPPAHPLSCRLFGALLGACTTTLSDADADARCRVALPPGAAGLEGALLVEALPDGMPLHRAGAPWAVLLTRDARIASEVAALGAAAADDAARLDAAEHVARVLGEALRPGAPPALLAAAGGLAARAGLPASLVRVAGALHACCASASAAAAAAAREPLPAGAAFEAHFVTLLAAAASAGGGGQRAARAALAAAHPTAAAGAALALALLDAAEEEGCLIPQLAIDEAMDALAAGRMPPATSGDALVPDCSGVLPSDAVRASAAAVLAALRAARDADARRGVDAAWAAADARARGGSEDSGGGGSDITVLTTSTPADLDDDAHDAAGPSSDHDAALRAAADEAGFIRYLADINLVTWRTIAMLTLSVQIAHMYLWAAFMRGEPSSERLISRGAVLRKQVRDTIFMDPRNPGAAPMTMLDFPWEAVVLAYAPLYVGWVCLLKMPAHATILFFSTCSARARPFVQRHYETIFHTCAMIEIATYAYMDMCIVHATGRVPIYALPDCVMHSIGTVFCHRTGPFRRRRSYLLLTTRLVSICFAACFTRAWALLLRPEFVVQFIGLGIALALTEVRERQLRVRYAQTLAAKQKTA
jgi:hypothetical protein